MTTRSCGQFALQCDKCGLIFDDRPRDSKKDIVAEAKKLGWTEQGLEHYCLGCKSSKTEMPWGDLKAAFSADDSEKVWEHFEQGAGSHISLIPNGWALCETDTSGARCVAVFRIEGIPKIEDGQRIEWLLERHCKWSG